MPRKIKYTNQYKRAFKRCMKRNNFPVKELKAIMQILVTRPFTYDEVYQHKVHKLEDSRKYKGCWELHIKNRNDDNLLVYQLLGNSVKFEDILVEFEDVGTHSDLYGSIVDLDDIVCL